MPSRPMSLLAVAGLAAGSVAVSSAALGAPSVRPSRAATAAGATATHHLAYLTNRGKLIDIAVKPTGKVTSRTVLSKHPNQVVASPDGTWLAWVGGTFAHPKLTVRDMSGGTQTTLKTNKRPVAFAGDELIGSFDRTSRLVLSPSPHWVKVPHALSPLAGTPGHVVNSKYDRNGKGGKLQLVAFDGTVTTLHHYTDWGPKNYRDVEQAWPSADGKHLLVERGNHQDFYGLGHSSLMDEFGLSGGNPRNTLGHFGTGKRVWRVVTATYFGRADQPWAIWESPKAGHPKKIQSRLAEWAGGSWSLGESGNEIWTAATRDGWSVTQPGVWRLSSGPERFPAPHPNADVQLDIATHSHGSNSTTISGVRGTQFWWVSG